MRITTENRDRNGHVLVWDQPGLEAYNKQQKPNCKFLLLSTHVFHIMKEMVGYDFDTEVFVIFFLFYSVE